MSDILATRYASKMMADNWSDETRYKTWRQIWWALAKVLYKAGVKDSEGRPRISEKQVDALCNAIEKPIDYAKVAEYEKKFKHDVMAHIHALGDEVPEARDIIHLGATSCDVTDNADQVRICHALYLLKIKLASILNKYTTLIDEWAHVPTLGYTHFQPAQLTTVGKRFCLWAQDITEDLGALNRILDTIKFRGLKGATGNQGSFVELLGSVNDAMLIDLDFTHELGFGHRYIITGQTYPRKLDFQVVSVLAGIAQSCYKFASDIRLLQHDGEIEEVFFKEQVGSSAMAYKRNPMRSERICGLARYVMNLLHNTLDTAANQWLERTLDDSSNRRIVIPQAFMATDGMLRIYNFLLPNLVINTVRITENIDRFLPFMVSEDIIMRAVKSGWDRQKAHEAVRSITTRNARDVGDPGLIWAQFRHVFGLKVVDGDGYGQNDPSLYIGSAAEQCRSFNSILKGGLEQFDFEQEDEDLEI